jgi:hypothetical protein
MSGTLADFDAFRSRMNALILGAGNLTISRFFALDGRAYEAASVGLVVGGSIVIPHVRRAMARLEEPQGTPTSA